MQEQQQRHMTMPSYMLARELEEYLAGTITDVFNTASNPLRAALQRELDARGVTNPTSEQVDTILHEMFDKLVASA